MMMSKEQTNEKHFNFLFPCISSLYVVEYVVNDVLLVNDLSIF